ncbi:unnamed protein product [Heterosigma akashiwo]
MSQIEEGVYKDRYQEYADEEVKHSKLGLIVRSRKHAREKTSWSSFSKQVNFGQIKTFFLMAPHCTETHTSPSEAACRPTPWSGTASTAWRSRAATPRRPSWTAPNPATSFRGRWATAGSCRR